MDALALVEAPEHVCCRYRVRAFEPALRAAGWSLSLAGLDRGPAGRLALFARAARYDAVLLQRKLLPGWQLGLLRRRARHLVFDFDDAVLYRDSYDRRGPHCPRRAARFARTVRAADRVLAGNDFLAECAARAGAKPERIRVVPTCVDPDRIAVKPAVSTGPGLDLVWIGSSSTLRGLEQQRPLLERIGREVPGTRLRLICDRFPRFDPLPVVPVRWSEATEVGAIAAGDVGISVVPDDLWSRGKCGLKLLQYRACGLPVVASPVGVHLQMVRPGIDGFLPETAEEWIAALRLLESAPERRRAMGRAARESTVRDYAVGAWSAAVVAALAGRDPVPAPNTNHSNRPTASRTGHDRV